MTIRLVMILVLMGGMATPAAASSWLPTWGNKGDAEKKPILGMAAPIENKSGAAPITTPAPVELSPADMEIMTRVLQDQTDQVKALRSVVAAREADAAAREKLNALAEQQRLLDAARVSAQRPPVASPSPSPRPVAVAPVRAPNAPIPPAAGIKPYVVPPVPVKEWQALSDADKKNNPPRGNITVKAPPVPTKTGE